MQTFIERVTVWCYHRGRIGKTALDRIFKRIGLRGY